MSDHGWIVIPRWNEFQHYPDRDVIWIKAYVRLLHDDNFLGLSHHRRGILLGLWLAYATSNRQLRDNTLTLTRQLGQRVLRADLDSLNDAGFIEFSASKPLALTRSREKRRGEKKTPISPLQKSVDNEAVRSKAIAWIDNSLPHLDGTDLEYVISDQFREIADPDLLADLIAYAQERRIERGSHERA